MIYIELYEERSSCGIHPRKCINIVYNVAPAKRKLMVEYKRSIKGRKKALPNGIEKKKLKEKDLTSCYY